jgi:hypothetical protein
MAYLTLDRARAAAGAGPTQMMEKSLRASAAASPDTHFDIFLSHCIKDARAIEGVRQILLQAGLTVYVDWIEDPELSRDRVTTATAARLRERMDHSRAMIFATSQSSPDSKWMPWELGYFDGHRRNRVGVLPLVSTSSQGFRGQEYLGLYPDVEDAGIAVPRLGFRLHDERFIDIPGFVRQGVYLSTA